MTATANFRQVAQYIGLAICGLMMRTAFGVFGILWGIIRAVSYTHLDVYKRQEYYYEKTIDLINDFGLSSTSGFSSYKNNMGEILNKGFELQLRADVYKRQP